MEVFDVLTSRQPNSSIGCTDSDTSSLIRVDAPFTYRPRGRGSLLLGYPSPRDTPTTDQLNRTRHWMVTPGERGSTVQRSGTVDYVYETGVPDDTSGHHYNCYNIDRVIDDSKENTVNNVFEIGPPIVQEDARFDDARYYSSDSDESEADDPDCAQPRVYQIGGTPDELYHDRFSNRQQRKFPSFAIYRDADEYRVNSSIKGGGMWNTTSS